MKGQMGPQNLIEILLAIILFVYVVYPVENQAINDYILTLQANPQSYTTALIFIIQMWPVVEGIAVLLLIWWFAVPKQAPGYY